jgi:hypothetical protein
LHFVEVGPCSLSWIFGGSHVPGLCLFLSTLDPKRFGEFQIEIYNDATMRGIPLQMLVDAF